MFGFRQKHHNSQLQNETSATAVSVVLVECYKILYEASIIQKCPKVYLLQMTAVKSKLQTTICPFTIVPRRNRLVHRRYLVKSKLCNVTDLSAPYQLGFSHQGKPPGLQGVEIAANQKMMKQSWRWASMQVLHPNCALCSKKLRSGK